MCLAQLFGLPVFSLHSLICSLNYSTFICVTWDNSSICLLELTAVGCACLPASARAIFFASPNEILQSNM